MPSGLSVAVVAMACASDPEPGSVRQKAAIVVPVAGENIFRHGAMSISFNVFRNSLIYHKGDVIAAATVPNGNNQQLAGSALQQLRIAITDNAISHGMPPTIADTPDASVSAFDTAYKQLTSIHGRAVLRAVATRDIRASGPLSTELSVTPAR